MPTELFNLSLGKCEAMLLIRKPHIGPLNSVTIGEDRIDWVKHSRLLGVTFLVTSPYRFKKEFCKQTETPEKEFVPDQKRPIGLVLQDNITISSIWTSRLGRLP